MSILTFTLDYRSFKLESYVREHSESENSFMKDLFDLPSASWDELELMVQLDATGHMKTGK